ncbi:MAG: hemolysin III family protein [Pseudomonadota bacterium]
MRSYAHIRPHYSQAERISDGVVHLVGIGAALVAAPTLIVTTIYSHSHAQPEAVVGAAVYGTTLILMLTLSALYNMIRNERWSELLRRCDHSGIYLKIAGTYTPFLLLSGIPSPGLLIGLWSSALLGTVLKIIDPHRFRWIGLALYLAMGWAVVFAGQHMLSELSPAVWQLILAGGLVYTAGVGFFLMNWMPYHNTIWHVFVLTGTVLFYVAIALRISVVSNSGL